MVLLSMFTISFGILIGSQLSYSRSVVEESKECTGSDTCVAIEQCLMFDPDFTDSSNWSHSLKEEFDSRVCERKTINGTGLYKVCCPPKQGIDLLDQEGSSTHSEVASQSVFGESKECTGSDTCVAIEQCPMFGPDFTDSSNWSHSLNEEFDSRVCERKTINGTGLYKVCCPPKRGIDLLDLQASSTHSEVASQSVFGESKECTGSDTCVAIEQCPMFGPDFTDSSNWSHSLKEEFDSRVCERKTINGTVLYKVCCSPKRGIDLLDLEGCGTCSVNKIARGQDAKLFQFPWMALLIKGDGGFVCGGTLINERYVLTAAHCLIEMIVTVRLGEYDLSSETDCNKYRTLCAPPHQDIAAERIIPHELYSGQRKENDIGLIRLAQKASFNDNVQPICLPVGPTMRTTQTTFFVAGWGTTEKELYSNILQYTKLNLLPIDECQQQWVKLNRFTKLTNNQMCAIGANLTDSCTGDSGGPLKSLNVNAQYVQYGVVSFGLRTCGKESAPGVYTRVESYIDWILDNLEE